MTDYSKLSARVRSPFALTERDAQEIADALEVQAKEIAVLRAALTPLADMDYWIEPYHDAHDSIEQCNQLTVAEIRAARAALKGEK